MEDNRISVCLVLDEATEDRDFYKKILGSLFGRYDVEADIELMDALPSAPRCDVVIVMGVVSGALLNKQALAQLRKKDVPVVLFGVTADPAESNAIRDSMPYIDLVSSADTGFMAIANRFSEVTGDPCESGEWLASPGNSLPEPKNLQSQSLFISRVLDVLRQYNVFLEYEIGADDAQAAFNAAEKERKEGDFHLARLLYDMSYATSSDRIVLFRLGEVENLLGHVELARKNLLKAVKDAPDVIQNALQQKYRYDPSAFKNKFVEQCPLCGEKAIPWSVCWCPGAATYDPRFDPLRKWMYCPHCQHGFAYNIPADLAAIFHDAYSFTDKPVTKTNYSAVLHFARVVERLARFAPGRGLLDVGAGQGEFALAALQSGFDYTGIEVIPAYANSVQRLIGHRIYCANVMEIELETRYDIVVAGDVIEHVEDPWQFIRKIKSFLSDESILWLSTPDMFAPYHKLNPDADAMPREVWHLNYFTKASLEMLLREEGLAVVDLVMSDRYLGSIELICKLA